MKNSFGKWYFEKRPESKDDESFPYLIPFGKSNT